MNIGDIWHFSVYNFDDGRFLTLGDLLSALALFLAGVLLSSIVSRFVAVRLRKAELSADTVAILQRILFFFLVLVTLLLTLGLLKVPLTHLTFVSGALAVAVGFGAQAVINNFISGWILMTERPVRIDDVIELEGWRGIVEHIGNRSTRVRRIDGVHLMVPNSKLLEQVLVNWTLVDRNIRTSVTVGVAYGSPVRQVESLLYQVLGDHPEVLKNPEPLVVFEEFGDSALQFECLFWVRISQAGKEARAIRSDLRFRIDEVFREHGIVIAFPQRDVHFFTDGPIPVKLDPNG